MKIVLNPADGRKSFYGKCAVEKRGREYVLQSYETDVAQIDENGHFSRLWPGYSMTTMRHIRAFIAAFPCDFDGSKAAWDAAPIKEAETMRK